MAKVCNSHDLCVLEEIENNLKKTYVAISMFNNALVDKPDDNEIGILLDDSIKSLGQYVNDLVVWGGCMRKETDMNPA